MSEAGNTGVAGGTKGASPVPEKTAPDGSTVLRREPRGEPPDPPGGEQNRGYRVRRGLGVDRSISDRAKG